MPVKIRCRGCEKVLNAPDKARGRVIKCPHCETKLKVPGGDRGDAKPSASGKKKATVAKKPRKKVKAKAPLDAGDSGFFSALDLAKVEHQEERICPYCTAEMPEEETICPDCGMDVETRQMDEKTARKRRRVKKGINPELFYKGAWKESLQFVRENKSLALRTGWYWTIFSVLFCAAYYMAAHYCEKGPPISFWSFVAAVCALGIPGWYWVLSMKIVSGTMQKQEKFDRIHFDFFESVTTGSRAIFWPAVVLLPFMPIIIPMFVMPLLFVFLNRVLQWELSTATMAGMQTMIAVGAGFLIFPLVAFPLAMVHMTAKYTYKAWILWEMLKVFVRNIGPSLYWCIMALVTFIIPFGGLLVAAQMYGGGANPFINTHFLGMTENVVKMVLDEGLIYSAVLAIVRFVSAFVIIAPIMMLAGFPLVFLIRANGLLGLHSQGSLALVNKMNENTPATFWVRLLAFCVDFPLTWLTGFLVTTNKKALLVSNAVNGIIILLVVFWDSIPLPLLGVFWLFTQTFIYFVVSESTTVRSTIGKDGFGLIVSNDDHSQMETNDAMKRYFGGLANILTVGVGFLMCAFHPEKKALNDVVSKTEVVWKGDR